MTTQDNNEAASAPDLLGKLKFALLDALGFAELIESLAKPDVEIYKHELRSDAELAIRRINVAIELIEAASASQSSTAGAAKRGATFDELLNIGGSMSNVLYNVAQGSYTLAEYADTARSLCKKWDAARSDLAHVARQRQESATEPSLQNWLNIIHDNELSLGDRLERVSNSIRSLLAGDAPDKYAAHVIREQRFDAEAFAAASGKDVLAKDAKRDDFNCSTVLDYIQFLAWAIWHDHYRAASPNFCILADALGALSQIDIMVTGLKSTPSAAVAEGVDTALPEPWIHYQDAPVGSRNHFATDQMYAYGAQQREAGRLSGFREGVHKQALEFERAKTASLARHPVSAELPTNDEVYAEVCRQRGNKSFYVSTNAVNDVMAAVRARSAAPPAKAEGMSDTERAAVPDHLREFVEAIAHNFTSYDSGDDETSCRGCSALIPNGAQELANHRPDCIVPRARAILKGEQQ